MREKSPILLKAKHKGVNLYCPIQPEPIEQVWAGLFGMDRELRQGRANTPNL